MMYALRIPGRPVPFARAGKNPRATSKQKANYTPNKQRAYMARVKKEAARVMDGDEPLRGPIELQIRAVFKYPTSWSAKRKAATRWHTVRPDEDNLAKIIKDSFNGVVWIDDAQVCSSTVQKVYGDEEGVTIVVQAIGSNQTKDSSEWP